MAQLYDTPAMRAVVKRMIRSEMSAHNITYDQLVVKLEHFGVHQTATTLRSKVSKGTLGAQLFLYIMLALGAKEVSIERVATLLAEVSQE